MQYKEIVAYLHPVISQTTKGTDLTHCLDRWIKELDQYRFAQLSFKPTATAWSLGQLYVHLIQATHFFIKQIHICVTNNDNISDEAFAEARAMFSNNDFPDVLLDGPPSNATTPQPDSKERLLAGLTGLKDEIKKAEGLIAQSQFKGKTKHFALGYFTASEWMQFAEMHCRHHFRQRKRLDNYIREHEFTK
jgi:hypothetical protein